MAQRDTTPCAAIADSGDENSTIIVRSVRRGFASSRPMKPAAEATR